MHDRQIDPIHMCGIHDCSGYVPVNLCPWTPRGRLYLLEQNHMMTVLWCNFGAMHDLRCWKHNDTPPVRVVRLFAKGYGLHIFIYTGSTAEGHSREGSMDANQDNS